MSAAIRHAGRLALAAAQSAGDRFPDGVYFVPLAPVTEAERPVASANLLP